MPKALVVERASWVPALRELNGGAPSVGDVTALATVLAVHEPALELDRMLREDPALRGVVVRDGGHLLLLTRARADHLLAGPFGFGRALLARRDLRALLPAITLVVEAETPIPVLARWMLARGPAERYDDAVVTWADGAVGLAPTSVVFEVMSQLYQQVALHDPLTGLPNRLVIEHEAAGLLTGEGAAGHERAALLYVDLDHFKDVNDTLGHSAGDQVLVTFAARLTSAVRPGDLVVRLGGDEFAVLLLGVTAVAAQATAERIILLAAAPFVVRDAPVYIGASVGIALAGDVPGESTLTGLEVLLRQADAAMYRAKEKGRGQVHRLRDGDGAGAPRGRAAMVRRLRAAIAAQAFTLHYQPKLTLPGRELVEVEALLRWQDRELGPVGPAEFIPVAESTGLIVPIGLWVLDQACRQAQAWRLAGHDLTVAVNLSPVQITSPGLVGDVQRVLREHRLPPDRLRLEVTETAMVKDVHATTSVLRQLRDLGIRISLDDFGTGYSSLAMLAELPLHGVKIDRSFVERVDTSPGDAALIALIVQAAHTLGLTVIAEGVETTGQLEAVTRLGCDAAQGYLLGRPVPAEALTLPLPRTALDVLQG